jgi:hypothetical protein
MTKWESTLNKFDNVFTPSNILLFFLQVNKTVTALFPTKSDTKSKLITIEDGT